MPVFISHTTKDDALARRVFKRLMDHHKISCYIDDMDKELGNNRGKSSLTPLLVDRLRKCDTLLAVITENTKGSWWVPFEIGTAREMPKIIASYTSLPDRVVYNWQEALPEYLLEWPRLRTDKDIDIFASEYKNKLRFILESSGVENISQKSDYISNTRNFESRVMDLLGQGNY